MSNKVADYTGAPWSIQGIEKLVQLWKDGVPAELVSVALQRPEEDVRAKAVELGLPQHVEKSTHGN